jgi:hypothetical protein
MRSDGGVRDSYVLVDWPQASGDNSTVNRREQTRTLSFWSSVLLAIAACPGHALSQDPYDYVPNLPYTAQVVGTGFASLTDGTRVRYRDSVVQMRDSQGRTRIEIFQNDASNWCDRGKPNWVNLYIPLRRQFIQLFPGRKTASVLGHPGTGPIPRHGQNLGKTTTESLGGQLINGIYAEGTRITEVIASDDGRGRDIVYVEETWISRDLKIVVLAKGTNSTNPGEETTTEIRELNGSEPDATLFEIPKDYKIVTPTDGAGTPPP